MKMIYFLLPILVFAAEIVYIREFQRSADSIGADMLKWTSSNTKQSSCFGQKFFGGVNIWGQDDWAQRDVVFPQPYYKFKLSFFLVCIDTWRNNNLFLLINGKKVFTQKHSKSFSLFSSSCGSMFEWDGEFNVAYDSTTDNIIDTKIIIRLETDLKVARDTGSWGINEFQIVYSPCHFTCLTCKEETEADCLTCDIAKNRTFKGGKCVCLAGYFIFNNECQKCHETCKNCNNLYETNCTECDSTLFRRLVGGKCLCFDGYYQENNVCKKCQLPCINCESLDKCLTCALSKNRSYDSLTKTCPCNNYFYYDSSKMNGFVCQACHPTCIQCSGSLQNNCTKCDSTKNRKLNDLDQCACAEGYMEQNSLCIPCKFPCTECAGKIDFCKSCGIGYYKFNDTCLQCNPLCKQCVDSDTKCTQCFDEQYRELDNTNNQCQCKSSYFQVSNPPSNLTCQQCHYSCQECTGPSDLNCTKCDLTKKRQLKVNKCICLAGNVESNQECVPCHATCLTCSGINLNNCLTCDTTKNRFFDNVSKQCLCTDGFYEESQICKQCDGTCRQCYIQNNNCLSCYTNQNRIYQQSLKKCVCQTGYYYNIAFGNNICQKCHYSCLECTGPNDNNCTSCDSQVNRIQNSSNQCVCSEGYLLFDKSCVACEKLCKICIREKQICQECYEQQHRILDTVTKQCICQPSYFYNPSIYTDFVCKQCHQTCLECTGQENDKCTQCNPTLFRELSSNQCVCKQGYVEINSICEKCHQSCLTCNGTEQNQCLTCDASKFRQKEDSTNLCICMSNYYETSNECRQCSKTCKECSQNENNCQQCFDEQNRYLKSNQCICKDGYFNDATLSDPKCQECDKNCLTCEQKKDNCITCDETKNRVLDVITKKCLCKQGFYEDDKQQCQMCNSICKNCKQANQCTECYDNQQRALDLATFQCNCNPKYFYDSTKYSDNICRNCHYSCLSCNDVNNNNCLTCDNTLQWYIQGNQCLCAEGYYEINQKCEKCNIKCKKCIEQPQKCIECNTIEHNTKLKDNDCVCDVGFFNTQANPKCQQCSPKCLECQDESQKCTKCDSRQFRILNQQNQQCECQNGYYEEGGEIICKKCHYSCQNCTLKNTEEYCTTCPPQNTTFRVRELNNLSYGKCLCNKQYFDNSTDQICQKCDQSCLRCSGQNKNQCTECPSDKQLKPTNECLCLDGTYLQDNLCKQCYKLCIECSGDKINNCLKCNPLHNRILIEGYCICSPKYKETGDDKCVLCKEGEQCIQCPFHQGYQMINGSCKCISGFYGDSLFQNKCQQCNSECIECSGPSEDDCTIFKNKCKVENCISCKIKDNQACINCKNGYSLTKDGKCEITQKKPNGYNLKQAVTDKGYKITVDFDYPLVFESQELSKIFQSHIPGVNIISISYVKNSNNEIEVNIEVNENVKESHLNFSILDQEFCKVNKINDQQKDIDLKAFVMLTKEQIETSQQVSQIGQGVSQTLVGSMIIVVLFSNIYVIFSTIDITCLIYFLLYVKVRYPFNVTAFYDLFKNFQYAFIPNVYLDFVNINYVQEASEIFMAQGSDYYFFKNAGQSFTIITLVIPFYIFYKVMTYIKYKPIKNYFTFKIENTWEYCGFIDLICNIYIYVSFSAFHQFYMFDFEDDSAFINYALHAYCTLAVVVIPIIFGIVIHKRKNLKDDMVFQRQFASLVGGLNLYNESEFYNDIQNQQQQQQMDLYKEQSEFNSPKKFQKGTQNIITIISNQNIDQQQQQKEQIPKLLKYQILLTKQCNTILYSRKLIFIFFIVFLQNHPYFQLSIISLLNIMMFFYYVLLRPNQTKLDTFRNSITEVLIIFIHVTIYMLLEDPKEQDETYRINVGYGLIAFSSTILFLHIISLIYDIFFQLIDLIKLILLTIFRVLKYLYNLTKPKVEVQKQEQKKEFQEEIKSNEKAEIQQQNQDNSYMRKSPNDSPVIRQNSPLSKIKNNRVNRRQFGSLKLQQQVQIIDQNQNIDVEILSINSRQQQESLQKFNNKDKTQTRLNESYSPKKIPSKYSINKIMNL